MPSRYCTLIFALPLLATGCPETDADDGSQDADTSATLTTGPGGESSSGTVEDTTSGDASGSSGVADDSTSADSESTGGVQECGPPQQLGAFTPTDGDARGFAIVGDTVYLAVAADGLEVVDITDGASPVSLGAIDFPPGELAFTVSVAGDYAYVGKRGAGFSIVDISDPAMMVEVVNNGDDGAEDLLVVGDTLWIVEGNGIRSYDVSNPEFPDTLSDIVVLPGSSNALAIEGDIAYVAASGSGLVIVDISDPSAPVELATFPTSANATHVAVEGTLAYVSHADGLTIVNIGDPAMPAEAGVYARDRAHAVDVAEGRAYLLGDDTTTTMVPFLAIVDLSDPAAPVELDTSLDDYDSPHAIAIDGGRLLFSEEDDDVLHIVDPCPPL
jgi:hypothetical protein